MNLQIRITYESIWLPSMKELHPHAVFQTAHIQPEASLKEHFLRKHDEEPHYFECEKCDYKTVIKTTFTQNGLVEHKGIRYSCTTCEFKAISKTHTKYTHKIYMNS